MAKKRQKFPKTKAPSVSKRIRRPEPPSDKKLCFSFKYLQANHRFSTDVQFGNEYAKKLLGIFKELERLTVRNFRQSAPESLRVHRINWDDPRVTERSFGIQNRGEFDDEAWQFAITKEVHGRVHGFLVENVFYVVWLDPEHKLYS